ncbi:MAG: hypothetical protein JNK02_03960 [Planctomycetes bacterium]|nr:hypothetical protein [Planctomycetota bacterium]
MLPLLVAGGLVLWNAQATALGLLSDDAFYYLEIARSIVRGEGSSFDGISSTNGYHPLWMLVMVAACALAGEGLLAPVCAMILVSAVVCGATLALVAAVTERWAAPGFGALALAACLLPNLLTAMSNGLETALVLLTVFAWAWWVYRCEGLGWSAPARSNFTTGLWLGLIFLARLDSAFVVLAAGALFFAAGIVARVPWADLVRRSLVLVAGVLVFAAPYFLWCHAQFGTLSPISGRVKSSFPDLRARLGLDGDMRLGLTLVALDLLLAAAVFAFDRRRGRPVPALLVTPLTILAVGSALHFGYTFLYMSWGVYWWHFVVYGAAFVLGVAQAAHRASLAWPRSRAVWKLGLPALIAASGVALQANIVAHRTESHREWFQAAAWAREHTDEDSVFALKDAGLFGYFSARRVINLDGKANGYDYLERLERGEVLAYLEEHGTDYVADINALHVEGRALIRLPRARQPALTIWMSSEQEVYRGRTFPRRRLAFERADEAHFAIWKFAGRSDK